MNFPLNPCSGYMFCTHCNENVSESTYRRHMNSFKGRFVRVPLALDSTDSSSSSSDSDAENTSLFQEEPDSEPSFTDPLQNTDDTLILDSDLDNADSSDDQSVENSSSDTDMDEVWDDIPESLCQDIESPPPIPEPAPKKKKLQLVHSLVQWTLYFLLIWQSFTHLSDNGLTWLLRFLLQFLKALHLQVPDEILTELIAALPCSLYMMRQYLNLDRDNFTKYVVCPKCTKCHTYDECLLNVNGKLVGKLCNNTSYLRGRRQICNSQLVKKVVLKDKSVKFYPIHYYCYNGIINPLECLLKKKGLPEKCEEWRFNEQMDCMADIYDGKLWNDFKTFKGDDFLNIPRNYGFMLNFDYFQPMKHRKDYSVGVLYIVLLNLPRAERFRWENVIVVGIIPSMEHEPKSLNEFLKPAVNELKALWSGVFLQNSLSRVPLKFRGAVLCTSSDIPASRKLCGLKGHSAVLGCSRCLKKFPGKFGEKRDYSGFKREDWEKRTNASHRSIAEKIKKCKTKVQAQDLSKKFGVNYYSSLLDLEYFDVIRFCAIDPMHNLFLGTAKFVFKVWVEEGHLTRQQLRKVEARIEEMDVPPNIGRLPKKISSNYGSYTAEQWKNWTLLYSLFALKGILDEQHLKCWQAFTLACRYICKPVLTEADIIKGDGLLLKFCKEFQSLYGNKAVTPNMHLHCHLREVILDYGPIHSFWCFSFERYNGILGSISTNNRSVELQLMRKLTTSRFIASVPLTDQFSASFQEIILSMQGSFGNEIQISCQSLHNLLEYYKMPTELPLRNINWLNVSAVILPSKYKQGCFDEYDIEILLQVYNIMFPEKELTISQLSRTINKYGTLKIYGMDFGSKLEYRSRRSTGILASWPEDDGTVNQNTSRLVFGTVDFYFSHSLVVNREYRKHLFACVTWYLPCNDTIFAGCNPLHVFSKTDLLPGGPSRFLPVQKISSKCSFATFKNEKGEERYIVSPFIRHFIS